MKMFLYDVVVVVVIVVFVFVISDKDEGLFYLCLSESEFSVSCKRALWNACCGFPCFDTSQAYKSSLTKFKFKFCA